MIMGTAAYMSPEQARGKTVDKRADIWSFGVVLFEMLSGTRLFAGETVSDTLVAVLSRDPDWTSLPSALSPSVRTLLRRCLERDPKQRLRDIGEPRVTLGAPSGSGTVADPSAAPRQSGRLPRAGWPVAAALAVAVAALLVRTLTPAAPPPLLRFTISSASGATMDSGAGSSAISPDGRRIAFAGSDTAGGRGLWIQELDQDQFQPRGGIRCIQRWQPRLHADAKGRRGPDSGRGHRLAGRAARPGEEAVSGRPAASRYLRIQQVEPERPVTHIDLVLNWFEELKAKAASR